MRFSGFLPSVLAGLLACCCAGESDRLERELRDVETRLIALRADQDRLEERLDAVELGSAGPIGNARPAEDQPPSFMRPRLKVIHIGPDESSAPAAPPPADPPASIDPGAPDPRPVIRGQGDRVIRSGQRPGSATSVPRLARAEKSE